MSIASAIANFHEFMMQGQFCYPRGMYKMYKMRMYTTQVVYSRPENARALR